MQQQISELRRHIEDQEILLDVLEHDGHNVEPERAKLAIEKAKLARLVGDEPVDAGELRDARR
ncbi:hypothetical protein ACNJX9_36250 [Bradyrhizobium sp. DASA03076]|uniref:hypothetical protein n=1 Tax=Bradyrhizobium sp. BLXBL-03 TaxID=3395916 RepID=UPI003F726939